MRKEYHYSKEIPDISRNGHHSPADGKGDRRRGGTLRLLSFTLRRQNAHVSLAYRFFRQERGKRGVGDRQIGKIEGRKRRGGGG